MFHVYTSHIIRANSLWTWTATHEAVHIIQLDETVLCVSLSAFWKQKRAAMRMSNTITR